MRLTIKATQIEDTYHLNQKGNIVRKAGLLNKLVTQVRRQSKAQGFSSNLDYLKDGSLELTPEFTEDAVKQCLSQIEGLNPKEFGF